jgi:hypothetical protein
LKKLFIHVGYLPPQMPIGGALGTATAIKVWTSGPQWLWTLWAVLFGLVFLATWHKAFTQEAGVPSLEPKER